MTFVPKYLACLKMVVSLGLLRPSAALASDVAIAYHDPSLEPLSRRLSSELSSEGHQVHLEGLPSEPGCQSYADQPLPAYFGFERVRIHLGRVPGSQDAACAAIFYSTPSGVRQAHATSSLSDVAGFSIQVAEALIGLRTRALRRTPKSDVSREVKDQDVLREGDGARPPLSFGTSLIALRDLRRPSFLLGVGVAAELPLTTDLELQLDTAWMLRALPIEEGDTQLLARLAWTRLGVAFRVLSHPTEFDLTAGTGAAFTWVTARVDPPDEARADIATSIIFSAGGLFAYPSDAPLHGYLGLRATTLLPAVRFELPSGPTSPFGNLLIDGSVGARTSW